MDANTLKAYLNRIGYNTTADSKAVPSATHKTLQQLHQLHTQNIAFENLNPLLGMRVSLEEAAIVKKLIYDKRGGYCYEQNLLFGHVLRAIGFQVTGLEARVLSATEGAATLPRTHMLLSVVAEGKQYLADVGFGGLTPMWPLLLQSTGNQSTPQENYRLAYQNGGYTLEVAVKNQWRQLYNFDLQEQLFTDYEPANWYIASHPSSHFVHHLMASRRSPSTRYTLNNNLFSIYEWGKPVQKRLINSSVEWQQVLTDNFGLDLSGVPTLPAKLEELLARDVM